MNPCAVPPQRICIPSNPSLKQEVYKWINDLSSPSTRKNALLELSKMRGSIPDLAPMLWFSFGSVAALLQEVISAYSAISPPSLTAVQSSTVCNALALLQCLASHSETRCHFLSANIPLFLYPFLSASGTSRPFEYLRLTSLGVIGALVKCDDKEVISYLIRTEIIPLCLRIMEKYSDLSKTVATFIMQKILLDDNGLLYTCETYDRFSHVTRTLGGMVLNIAKEPPSVNQSASNLLKHIIRCFLRLSENPRAREALRQCIPEPLINGTFYHYLEEKDPSRLWLYRLAGILDPASSPAASVDERSYGI